jgi:spore germination cell wall hydrolase CwlJ-like protein
LLTHAGETASTAAFEPVSPSGLGSVSPAKTQAGAEEMTNDDWNRALLALVVWREARGEPLEGKLAVANVIRNRVEATHLPDQWDNIMERKWQFSSLTAPGDGMLVQWPLPSDPTWVDSMGVAERVYTLGNCDNTQGATFYANLSVVDPPWAHTMTETVKIGHHTFFRDTPPSKDVQVTPQSVLAPADTVTTGDISNTVVMMIVDQEV